MKTRKQAAIELNAIFNSYEFKKNSVKTTYNKIFKNGDSWRLIGYAHDYTV